MHTPPAGTTFPVPGVMVIHGTGWHAGSAQQVGHVADDIAAAGYYVVAVEYELARCGYIVDQPCHEDDFNGTIPDDLVTRQLNDIKAEMRALRADSHVYPKPVGVVGGSAGGSLALSVALDKTSTPNNDWPSWCQNGADDRPQCAVMLSGVYDFADYTPVPEHGTIDTDFLLGTENYVNTTTDLDLLHRKSPVYLVTQENTPFPPLFFINSWFDMPPPYHQIVDMICALRQFEDDTAFKTHTIMNSGDHSFHYWDSPDKLPAQVGTPLIKTDVIAYLDAHLK